MVWGVGGVGELLPRCPSCGATLVGLDHVLAECVGTQSQREGMLKSTEGEVVDWALRSERDLEKLRRKVRFVGTCLAILVHKLRGRPELMDAQGEEGKAAASWLGVDLMGGWPIDLLRCGAAT